MLICAFSCLQIRIYSLHDVQDSSSRSQTRAPKWLQCPCGVSFGIGGRFASFNSANGTSVQLTKFSMEPEFVKQAKALQTTLERDQMKSFVEKKASSNIADPHEAEIWKFLKLLYSEVSRFSLSLSRCFSYLSCSPFFFPFTCCLRIPRKSCSTFLVVTLPRSSEKSKR